MQEVYKDGSGGEIVDFDPIRVMEAMQNPEIDHVEIFRKDTPAHSRAIKRIKKRAKKKGIIK